MHVCMHVLHCIVRKVSCSLVIVWYGMVWYGIVCSGSLGKTSGSAGVGPSGLCFL